VSGSTAADVRVKVDELRRTLRLGGMAPAAGRVTLAQYLTEWIERDQGRVRPSTWQSREMHVRV